MSAIMASREEGELSESGGTRGSAHPMMDSFGRRIDYVRMSITDRCDLRCRYCMPERMEFLPRKDLLDLEEVVALADVFIARGVKRIRLTGGEPLIRKGFAELVARLGQTRSWARRADHNDQRHPARRIRRSAGGQRGPACQCQSGHAQIGTIPRDHAPGKHRRCLEWNCKSVGSGSENKNQHGCACFNKRCRN